MKEGDTWGMRKEGNNERRGKDGQEENYLLLVFDPDFFFLENFLCIQEHF